MKKEKNITYIDFNEPAPALAGGNGGTPSPQGKPPQGRTPRGRKPLKKGQITTKEKVKNVLAVIGTTFLIIFLIAIITLCIVAVALTVYVMQFAESSFDIDLTAAELSFTSVIMVHDPDANEGEGDWVEVKRLSGDENRIWVDIDDMPQHLIDAIVANEDHRFFEHEGVDWYRTVGVMVNALLADRVEGGSTITQQLVKNITGDDKVNAGRKLREIFRAISLEQKYTKLDILESYLNRIAFGGTSCGVGSAAWYYFDKNVDELTIAEAALMAGVIPSPHNYNPYNNARNARLRMEEALSQMHRHGFITTAQYEQALKEEVRFRRPISSRCMCPEGEHCNGDYFGYIDERYLEWAGLQDGETDDSDLYYEETPWEEIREHPYKWSGDYEITQDWYIDAAIYQVTKDLAELRGVSEERAMQLIRDGGFTIYLNVDIKMQAKLNEFAADPYNFVRFYDETAEENDVIQGGIVIMDMNGKVVALAGGIGEKKGDFCFNRATQSIRSIGSTIKPISVYAPAVDMNLMTYSTLTRDLSGLRKLNPNDPNSPVEYWPYNYEQDYPGSGLNRPTWYAVQKSLNTIAVRTLQKVGFHESYTMMNDKLGFSHLDSAWDMNWSPLALGALTNGATLDELAAAYAIFGTGGVYYEPYLYEKVVDHNGKVVLEQEYIGTQAIDKDSAWVMNRMLKTVVDDENGTGKYARIPNVEVIGKTGTSNDEKNLLYCGLSPEYVMVYRLGYDNGRQIKKSAVDGWLSPARVWGNFMNLVVDGSVPQSFSPDPSVLHIPYCNETGLVATSRCPNTNMGYYKASHRPACDAMVHDGITYWQTHGDPPNFRPEYN